MNKGVEALSEGREADAQRHFEKAVRANPDSAEVHYYLGLMSSRRGQQAAAIKAFQEADRLDSKWSGLQASLGIAYYKTDELSLAESHLKKALRQNGEDASASFFLGLCLQRQDRYRESIAHFQTTAKYSPELEALAWYNIGRSRAELGQIKSAKRALYRAMELDQNGDAGDAALALLMSFGAEVESESKPWSVTLGGGLEYDDNLSVPESDFNSGESDTAAVFDLSAIYETDWREVELEAGYDFYQSLYFDVDDLDMHSHSISGTATTEYKEFDPSASYRYTNIRLGGDPYLQVHSASIGAGRVLQEWWYVNIAYNLQGRDFDDGDDSDRDGLRNILAVDHYFFYRPRQLSGILSWYLEVQDADGSEFDYLGNRLRFNLRGPTEIKGLEVQLEVGYDFEDRDYDNVTPSIGKKRWDKRHTFHTRARIPVAPPMDVVFDYRYIDSDSNLPEQDYEQNIVTLRVEMRF